MLYTGATLRYEVRAGQLDLTNQLDHMLRNRTQGLLGNYNGDMSDDLTPRGSTQPLDADTATLEEIHYQFGETCQYIFNFHKFGEKVQV